MTDSCVDWAEFEGCLVVLDECLGQYLGLGEGLWGVGERFGVRGVICMRDVGEWRENKVEDGYQLAEMGKGEMKGICVIRGLFVGEIQREKDAEQIVSVFGCRIIQEKYVKVPLYWFAENVLQTSSPLCLLEQYSLTCLYSEQNHQDSSKYSKDIMKALASQEKTPLTRANLVLVDGQPDSDKRIGTNVFLYRNVRNLLSKCRQILGELDDREMLIVQVLKAYKDIFLGSSALYIQHLELFQEIDQMISVFQNLSDSPGTYNNLYQILQAIRYQEPLQDLDQLTLHFSSAHPAELFIIFVCGGLSKQDLHLVSSSSSNIILASTHVY